MWGTRLNMSGGEGGFMNNSSDVPFSPSPQKKGQAKPIQRIVPLVTRQIRKCPDEEFTLFGMPVQIANIVGILRNFEVQSTKATCIIEDHTGSIKAIMWLEIENDSMGAIPPVKEFHYVKVFGSIRNEDGEKILMILKMFPIDDCNVVTNHLLQAIHARLAIEKSMVNEPGAPTTSMSSMDVPKSTSTGLTKLQEQILHVLQPIKDDIGVSRDDILEQFRSNREEANDALQFLMNEGHVYSTVDNDHFKATDF